MVTPESALHALVNQGVDDAIPIDADHSEIVKFHSRLDKHYAIVRGRLLELTAAAPRKLKKRGMYSQVPAMTIDVNITP